MSILPNLEFHRAAIGLVPGAGSETRDSAIYIEVPGMLPLRSCTCSVSKRRTCEHLEQLSKSLTEYQKSFDRKPWTVWFTDSVWYRFAHLVFDGEPQSCSEVRVNQIGTGRDSVVRISSSSDEELARYLDPSSARIRFLERTGKVPTDDVFVDRAGLIERLTLFQMRPEERKLIDYGMHPPTIYFPLPNVAPETMLIEPTETESREQIEVFVEAMIQIAKEAGDDPDLLHNAPHHTPVRRLDEATAARKPVLRWRPDSE